MSLNFKFENPKDVSPIYQKPPTTQQIKTSTAFGQPGAFEEFEQFGKVQKTENPFGDSFQVSGFSSAETTQTVEKQAKIDLLNIDEDAPQKQQTVDVDPFQQNSQQTQQTGVFDAFATGWNQQQPQQPQQSFIQSNKSSQPFDAFNLVGSVGQIGQVPPQQGFSNQQGGVQAFDQRFPQPQKQEQLNILNLYGNQQPVVGNLAYSAFPQVYTQPMVQSQPTPFDLFR
ncbi:unnamed protein product (macronuclear) [Paramecium tetraurelia]|uniref:Uncharacterized protein n=1 Tax=Paramecium tetraurelia TaxID=5888 RepID=A0E9M8_PARTE|nr:uncharacterized protein GSPATT00024726001 [Paramecium tetraurelia]CAK91995.1 unnamed protein product [Paramecium tetraurelia]|eukprot:XP_001459392.1 hypothetical protein (macronuclear) [Paramecium tetraurelia strain d4-2]